MPSEFNIKNGFISNSNSSIIGNLTVTGGTQSLFSGSSSVEMVKIIQDGSGDAFVVEDQSNTDPSHFVINASGDTAIGLTQPLGNDKLTVSGNTSVYGNFVANTISATTYFNLPITTDVRVTGATYSNNTFTYTNNTGGTFNVLFNTLTGLTVNGNLSVTGSTTSNSLSATTITGTTLYGNGSNLTGVVKGSGTFNYITKWTGTTGISNSIIQDDGTNVGVGTSPQSYTKLSVATTAGNSESAITALNSNMGASGVKALSSGNGSAGTIYGLFGESTDAGTTNIGVYGLAYVNAFSSTNSIGGKFQAEFATNNYSVQLIDGTEGINKVLISNTSDGKANWSSVLSGLTNIYTNTISATTYFNLPTDIRVTGASYNNNNTFTYTNNTGGTFNVLFNTVSGLTVNGSISATTISGGTFYGNGSSLTNIPIAGVTNLQSSLDDKFDKSGGTVTGSVLVTGDVTILGTATTINTQTLTVKDNIITINNNYTGNTVPYPGTSGIEVLRGSATTATVLWDETSQKWVAGITGNTKQILLSGDSLSLLSSGHTHPISEITNLQSSLDNKYDKSGGTVSGNVLVTNDVTISGTSLTNKLGINKTPSYTLDILSSGGTTNLYYNDTTTTSQGINLSGKTDGLYYIGVEGTDVGTIRFGVVGKSQTASSVYGKTGDSYVYSSVVSNGLNIISSPGTGTDDYIRFYAGTNASATVPDMYIQGSGSTRGYIGIGTSNPTERLDVSGSTILRGLVSVGDLSGSDAQIKVGAGRTVDGNAYIDLIGDTTYTNYGTRLIRYSGVNASTALAHRGSGLLSIGTQDSGSLQLVTSNSVRMYISSSGNSGNIGIGTTSPIEKLHVVGNTLINGDLIVSGNSQSLFSGNSSIELVKIIQTGTGDAFVVEDQANTDPSHFVINASGNTAIGLTQPIGNDKLTVSGNTTVYGALSATTVSGDGSGLYNIPFSGVGFNYGLANAISNFNFLT